jgi:intracellular multiplication protein IcmT
MSVAHWRNSYKPVKFFFMDVRVGVVVVLTLLHVAWWTILLDLVVIGVGYYIERIGLGFPSACRAVRAWFAGSYRPALPYWKIRRKVDYEHRRLAWQPAREGGVQTLKEVRKDA